MLRPESDALLHLASALVLLCWSVAGSSAEVRGIDIMEFGIYELSRTRASGTEIALVERTDRVPAVLGSAFGVRYHIDGSPLGGEVTITVITKFPEGGLENPETREVRRQDRRDLTSAIGDVRFLGYALSKDWEVVPGQWAFELWSRDVKLAEKSFQLYAR